MSAVLARPRRRGLVAGVVVLFALLFAWQLLGAVTNLLFWLGLAAAAEQSLSAFAWLVLVGGIAVPVVAFLFALAFGRRRPPGTLALLLLLAFCAAQALGLTLLAAFLDAAG